MEKFVLRRPGAHVGSAQRHSSESQALASHGNNDMVRPHDPCLEIAPCLMYHLVRTEFGPLKADDLPPTLDRALGCEQPLEFVPGLAINSGHHTFARLDGRGANLDNGRFGCSRSNRLDALTEDAASLLGMCRSTFPLIQVGRPLGQSDGSLRGAPSLLVIATARKQLSPNRAPGDRWLQRVSRETLTLRA